MRIITVLFLVALLSGCATFKKDIGFHMEPTNPEMNLQEPWTNVALRMDISTTDKLFIAPVKISFLSDRWNRELVDTARAYAKCVDREEFRSILAKKYHPIGGSGQKICPEGQISVTIPLRRSVFRSVEYDDASGVAVAMYDAVVVPNTRMFFVIVPSGMTDAMRNHNFLIISSDGRFAYTMTGEEVDLPGAITPLPKDFFLKKPSRIVQVIPVQRSDPYGEKILTDLGKRFPIKVAKYGYSASAEYLDVALMTKGARGLDCGITKGSLALGPTLGLGAVISGGMTLYHAGKEECFR